MSFFKNFWSLTKTKKLTYKTLSNKSKAINSSKVNVQNFIKQNNQLFKTLSIKRQLTKIKKVNSSILYQSKQSTLQNISNNFINQLKQFNQLFKTLSTKQINSAKISRPTFQNFYQSKVNSSKLHQPKQPPLQNVINQTTQNNQCKSVLKFSTLLVEHKICSLFISDFSLIVLVYFYASIKSIQSNNETGKSIFEGV